MPLPIPKQDEKQDDFVARCMSNDIAKRDFPDEKQRLAVCYRQEKIRKHEASRHITIEASLELVQEGEGDAR